MALPDQLDISAVRKPDEEPFARNILIDSGSFICARISILEKILI